MHEEDGPNLVRYFEQLVREEVSSCNLERLEPKCLERLQPKCLDSDVANAREAKAREADYVVEEGATEESEPFTAAQHSEINRIFTNTFAGFIDQIIGKVQNMITNEMQTSFDPVCCDLRNQIELLRNEILYKLAPVQIGMKRYSFKRKSDNLHDQNEQNLVHDPHVDNNLMQFD